MKARNAALLAALAAFPAGQIAQQQGIVKFAGDVTIRDSISIDQLPPLSFENVGSSNIVILTDADGWYTVPDGKSLRFLEGEVVGKNKNAANFQQVSGVSIGPNIEVGADPSGDFDVGSSLNVIIGSGAETTLYFQDSITQVRYLQFAAGSQIRVRDNFSDSPNGREDRVYAAFQLISA
jgi:hypothetical protein